jgi:hypothetical protein
MESQKDRLMADWQADGWKDGQMYRQTVEQTDGWKDRQTDGGQTDGQTDRRSHHFND